MQNGFRDIKCAEVTGFTTSAGRPLAALFYDSRLIFGGETA